MYATIDHAMGRADMIESDVQALILIYVTGLPNAYLWRQNSGVFHDSNGIRRIRACPAGTPDVIGMINGRFIGIECKRARGGEVLESQKICEKNIIRGGGIYIIARSVDDVRASLEAEGIV